MLLSLKQANYLWLLPALLFMFTSHALRAIRWRYFLDHIKKVKVHPLFSALMIGYAANNVFPLRMGEFLRAFAIGKSQDISKSSAFASVFVERLIDVLCLLGILAVTVLLISQKSHLADNQDFAVIKTSGYVIFGITVSVIVLLIFLMEKTEATINFMQLVLVKFPNRIFAAIGGSNPNRSNFRTSLQSVFKFILIDLPAKIFDSVQTAVRSFLQGFMVFKRSEHYLTISLLSVAIWILYAGVIYVAFFAFGFHKTYDLDIFASLVVLVTVSIGIMIPSSPGFVGTYHWFCMISLALFHVPESQALSFAVVSHLVNFIPATLVGLGYFWKENLQFSDAMTERELVEHHIGEDQVTNVESAG